MDAHAKPPTQIKTLYKEYQKLKPREFADRPDLIHFDDERGHYPRLVKRKHPTLPAELRRILEEFTGSSLTCSEMDDESLEKEVYQIPSMPGLLIYPSLLPSSTQTHLLSKLLHRDLSSPQHRTNVHLHHTPTYPPASQSFFSLAASPITHPPRDPKVHKTLTTPQLLNKKLRWTTLGGQYDWTLKQYPSSPPPPFPPDTKRLVENLFPTMKAEAAIVNLYSPGDTLSLHRDVSEECDRPLVSISLGCEAIFICGLSSEQGQVASIRLRSGDAVLMSGESRYAWHGVPKILEGTCPEWIADWPGDEYPEWRGWMAGKRVNLNVRQMFA